MKVPLGTWLLILLGSACMSFFREYRLPWRSELILLLPGAAVFLLASSQTGFSHHMRYVLPAFPFVFISASRVARSLLLQHWSIAAVAGAGIAWSVASSIWIYPHSLSYFNESIGGPANGEFHLIDSNIDWGQDLFFLKRWLDDHPEARPLGIAYFPSVIPPELAGIPRRWPRMDPRSPGLTDTIVDGVGPEPGWYAISVNELHVRRRSYAYFLEFQPVARAGYSIVIYHITSDQANDVRRKLGLPTL